MGAGVSLTLLPTLGILFLLYGCFAQSLEVKVSALSYCILFYNVWYCFLEACTFLEGDGGGVDMEQGRGR